MSEIDEIKNKVRQIDPNDPKILLSIVEKPFEIDTLCKLKNNYSGAWRNNFVSFLENIKSSYDVEHIKKEIDTALNARSNQENFFANLKLSSVIAIGAGILYWIIFNFLTGLVLFVVLAVCFYIGYNSANRISKQYFSGDTLRIIEDFSNLKK